MNLLQTRKVNKIIIFTYLKHRNDKNNTSVLSEFNTIDL